MKKSILIVGMLTVLVLSASAKSTEAELFNELNAAYQSGSLPGAVEYVSQLEKNYPRSLLLPESLCIQGESLYKLGRYQESIDCLSKAIPLCKKNPHFLASCYYWRGLSYNKLENFGKSFDDLAVVSGIVDKGTMYNNAVFVSGKNSYCLNDLQKTIPLFEYVVSNGSEYSVKDFTFALIGLLNCYNASNLAEKTVAVFESVAEQQSINPVIQKSDFNYIQLLAGDGYQQAGKYKYAYDCYAKVLKNAEPDFAAVGLQKAYLVASSHKKDVGQDPGSILSEAKDNLVEYPNLLSEFWTRLGIDAFNEGDYKKAGTYFNNAEETANGDLLSLIGLYKSELVLVNGGKPSAAEELLKSFATKSNLSAESKYFDNYNSAYLRLNFLKEDFDSIIKDYANLKKSDKISKAYADYFAAVANYKSGNFKNAILLLDNIKNVNETMTHNVMVLKALCCAKSNRLSDAEKIFSNLDLNQTISDQERLVYSKVLLLEGRLNTAYRQAARVKNPEGAYVAGLALFNLKDWKTCDLYFSKYLSSKETDFAANSLFYDGYALYRQNKIKEAARCLSDFTNKYPDHEMAFNAHIVAANSFVQQKKFSDASIHAEQAVKKSSNQKQKQEAVILNAGIYSDMGNHSQAVSFLEPYSKGNDDFSVQCLYNIALIYAKNQKRSEADEIFTKIVNEFPENPLAEESSYRRAEIYYDSGDFKTSAAKFQTYTGKYPKGNLIDAAYYYMADSFAKIEQNDRAIVQYSTLITNYPESSYSYSAEKNLVTLYRVSGDYSEALTQARKIIEKYGEQARKDGIPSIISDLQRLNGGEDEQVVKQRQLYKSAGGVSNPEGRGQGTKLASLLFASENTQKEAVELAEQILKIQIKEENIANENVYAYSNAELISEYYRSIGKNKIAAEKYLEAAQYARMSSSDEKAARALYGAAEAFDAAGMKADSKECALKLKELYPTSSWAEKAGDL